jgi:tetratricopeptide (TPR) repeat protein
MRRWILTLALLLPASSLSFGQDASVWIGHKVIKFAQTPLRVENRVIDDHETFRIYTVEQAKGGWLWLVGDDVKGWVPANQVIQYELALPYLDQVLRRDPNADWALAMRAAVWGLRNEYRRAEADYSEYIRRDPTRPFGYLARGGVLYNQARYSEAIDDLTFVIQHEPENRLAHLVRGTAFIKASKLDEALVDFNDLIHLDSTYQRGLGFEMRGGVYLLKGNYSQAFANFDQRVRLDPTNARCYQNRGVCRASMKDYAAAITDLDEAARLDPKYFKTYITRGNVRVCLREYNEALNDFDVATKLAPEEASPFDSKAWLLSSCLDASFRDGPLAVTLATRACEITQWKKPGCLETLAMAYAEAGDFDKAVEWQRKALDQTAPGDRIEAQERLALFQRHEPFRFSEDIASRKPVLLR